MTMTSANTAEYMLVLETVHLCWGEKKEEKKVVFAGASGPREVNENKWAQQEEGSSFIV